MGQYFIGSTCQQSRDWLFARYVYLQVRNAPWPCRWPLRSTGMGHWSTSTTALTSAPQHQHQQICWYGTLHIFGLAKWNSIETDRLFTLWTALLSISITDTLKSSQKRNLFFTSWPTEIEICWFTLQRGQVVFVNCNSNALLSCTLTTLERWWQGGPQGSWPRQDGTDQLGSSFWVSTTITIVTTTSTIITPTIITTITLIIR